LKRTRRTRCYLVPSAGGWPLANFCTKSEDLPFNRPARRAAIAL